MERGVLALTDRSKHGTDGSLLWAKPKSSQLGGGVEQEGLGTGSEELAYHGNEKARLAIDSGAHDGMHCAHPPQQ